MKQRFVPFIVCEEKHDNFYYQSGTIDDFLASSLSCLKRRDKEGCYAFLQNYEQKPDIDKEFLATFPDGSTKEGLINCWNQYDSQTKRVEEKKRTD